MRRNGKKLVTATVIAVSALLVAMLCGCSGKTAETKTNTVPAQAAAATDAAPKSAAAQKTDDLLSPVEPGGSFFDIKMYPGSLLDERGSVDVEIAGGASRHRRELVTADSVADVGQHYKNLYPQARVVWFSDKTVTFILPDGTANRRIAVFPDPLDSSKTAIKLIADS